MVLKPGHEVRKMEKKLIGWYMIDERALQLAEWARLQKFTGIVAIARGGIVPGLILTHQLNLPIRILEVNKYHTTANIEVEDYSPEFGFTLIIDDIIDQGDTMSEVVKMFRGSKFKSTCLFWKPHSKYKPDYYIEKVPNDVWLVFPWEDPNERRTK